MRAVSLNLVLLQQQQQAEMALVGRVNICCASKITSMLHFLPFASASCACLLRATGGGPGRPAALGLASCPDWHGLVGGGSALGLGLGGGCSVFGEQRALATPTQAQCEVWAPQATGYTVPLTRSLPAFSRHGNPTGGGSNLYSLMPYGL